MSGKHRKRIRIQVRSTRGGKVWRTPRSMPAPKTRKASFLWKSILGTLGCLVLLATMAGGGFVADMLRGLPSVSANTFTNKSVGTTVYDIKGRVIGTFSRDGDRQPIGSLTEVSKSLIDAFIAAEDKSFYHNVGIDPVAMARAAVQNIVGHKIESGASTITQQTVKLAVFPEQQRTLKRKIQEIALSLEVNRMLTKDEIMMDYMNWVYMGRMGSRNVYGVKTAAQYLFRKDPRDLNLPEAAFIAAIPNNPAYFSPYVHSAHTVARQHYILKQMLENGTITKHQFDWAMAYPIEKHMHSAPASAERYPYIMAQVQLLMDRDLVAAGLFPSNQIADQALPTEGYKVFTSIDLDVQNHLDKVLSADSRFRRTDRTVPSTTKRDLYQAAAVVVDNATGGVVALDGGRPNHYEEDQVDHTDAPRQPGSTMKPLVVYGPALEKGLVTAATMVDDGPAIFDEGLPWEYRPKDDTPNWRGLIPIRQALVESLNLPAVRTFHRLHPEVGTSYLSELGIHVGDKSLAGQPTLVDADTHHLGTGIGGLTYGLTLQQMTSAYTVFPNQGVWRSPVLLRRIADRTGSTLFTDRPIAHRVFSPETAFIMTSMMRDVVSRYNGTAYLVGRRFPGAAIAGKTGTTDDQENGWFVGFTPKYTTGIWTGYNHNQPIPTVAYGLKFRLWNDAMAPLVTSPASAWTASPPPHVMSVKICTKTGQLAAEGCTEAGTVRDEWFARGTVPTSMCEVHRTVDDEGTNTAGESGTTELPAVHIVNAQQSTGGVMLSWVSEPAAALYTVWRSVQPDGPFERIAAATPFTVFVDNSAPAGSGKLYYQVHAETGEGVAIPSDTVVVDRSTNRDDGGAVPTFP